jgi:hypothetical protein
MNMNTVEQPKPILGSRLCLSVTPLGLTVYGNPAGLRALAKWLEWIASQNPTEHFECHVGMDILDDRSKFENKSPPNVWVVIDEKLAGVLARREAAVIDGEQVELKGFDLTFMSVLEAELDEMAKPGFVPASKER